MEIKLTHNVGRVERPWYVWIAIGLELLTAAGAIPVGLLFINDPSGAAMPLPPDWIQGSVFGSYLVPGVYLFSMNGLGMLAFASLSLYRHWLAPWLTGVLGSGLIIWILVQLLVMPETRWLQWFFLAAGIGMGFVALSGSDTPDS